MSYGVHLLCNYVATTIATKIGVYTKVVSAYMHISVMSALDD